MPDASSSAFNFLSNSSNKSPNLHTLNSPAVPGNLLPTPASQDSPVDVDIENNSGLSPLIDGSGDNCLDSSSDEINCPTTGFSNLCRLDKLTAEVYNHNDFVTARILKIKPIGSSVDVKFHEQSIELHFQTIDEKFLAVNKATVDTTFIWETDLADKIVPEESNSCIRNVNIELNLKKKDKSKKWTSLPPPASAKKSSVGSNLCNGSNDKPKFVPHLSTSVASCSTVGTPICESVHSDENNKLKPFSGKSMFKQPSPPVMKVSPGFTGLRNIGNTCFMNSTLQALVNSVELKRYFCKNYHFLDINIDNPLGMKGELAVAFGDFMKEMWSGQRSVHEPSRIKTLMGYKSSQFMNYGQHDAQEFLSFLLDGLHEDLNRILKKPLTEEIEADGRSDTMIADLSWNAYKSRNDSIIVDLFHGQLKSRLHCPECDRVSITFDPFVYLALPFPKAKTTIQFYFWPSDIHQKPKEYTLAFPVDYTVEDFLNEFSNMVNVKIKNVRVIEVFNQRFHKMFSMHELIKKIAPNDIIYVVEVLDESDIGDKVIEFGVVQRKLTVANRNVCHFCQKESKDVQFCVGCYKAAYCNRACQSSDWIKNNHQDSCRNSTPELFGQPFWVSVPKSKATYKNIVSIMTVLSSYSVDFSRLKASSSSANQEDNNKGVVSKNDVEDFCNEEKPMELDADIEMNHATTNNDDSKSSTEISPVFIIRKCTADGKNLCNLPASWITDKGNNVLDISKGEYLSMDWMDRTGSLDLVQKETLDCDVQSVQTKFERNEDLKLSDLLDVYAETEKLNPQEAWYCNKCKKHQEAEKTLLLWRLPPLLIVQFKRFCYSSNIFRSKIETPVDYPVKGLDLFKFLCPGAPKQSTVYDLYAVVCHSGTPYFGHYVGYARLDKFGSDENEIEWRLFDDSQVCRVSDTNAVNNSAYLLFYKRRDDESKNIIDRYASKSDIVDAKIEAFEKLPRATFAATNNDVD